MTVRIVHLADLHLGYRAYYRSTLAGINQREADVACAFRCALDQIVQLRPDLIVVAGDVFHSVRPSNHALVEAFRRWSWIREQLPGTPIVIAAGNHDLPKSSEAGCVLRLFTEIPNIHLALEPTSLDLGDVHVRCIPETPRPVEIGEPSPTARWNVLVAHGETPAMAARWSGDPRPRTTLDPARFTGWDLVCLGHYHVMHQVGERAWYAGSLEYVSSNPWDELREERQRGLPGKGFLEVELATGAAPAVRFHHVPARRFVDLPPIDAAGLAAADVMARIAAQVPELDGIVIRQKVLNIGRETAQALDYEQIRAWKAAALHFQLDLRRAAGPRVNAIGAVRKRATLAEAVADFFQRREWSPDVDRERAGKLAEALIAEAAVLEEQRS